VIKVVVGKARRDPNLKGLVRRGGEPQFRVIVKMNEQGIWRGGQSWVVCRVREQKM
jgi:hypothetical protein